MPDGEASNGIRIDTSEVTADSAKVQISIIVNPGNYNDPILITISDPDGKMVRYVPGDFSPEPGEPLALLVVSGGNILGSENFTIPHPRLWSPESPALYSAKFEILHDGKAVDTVVKAFGLRSIEFTKDRGL
ncbi:MAG TPA: hypothetical protein VG733_19000, partial [Chthoniobacteraceae bacterium]|nr:hypothetical protein [Chthoniobacteraceae bacterium]